MIDQYHCLRSDLLASADSVSWDRFPAITPFFPLVESSPISIDHTLGRLTWDDRGLGAMITTTTRQIAAVTRSDEPVFHDNAIELFFDPLRNGVNYTELQVNAAGRGALLRMNRPYHLGGDFTQLDSSPIRISVHHENPLNTPSLHPVRWSVFLDIPWDLLAVSPPKKKNMWRMNIAVVEWEYEFVAGSPRKKPDIQPRYIAWHQTGMNDLHRPNRWGELVFS